MSILILSRRGQKKSFLLSHFCTHSFGKLLTVLYVLSYVGLFLILGISGKSQILFATVYLSRYLDLFTTFVSVYNTFMKVVFIGSSLGTLYLMYLKFRATYDHNHDSFRIEFLLLPCFVLGLLINHEFSVQEVSGAKLALRMWLSAQEQIYQWKHSFRFKIMWTFSIYLESVAILPQLFLVSKTGEAER